VRPVAVRQVLADRQAVDHVHDPDRCVRCRPGRDLVGLLELFHAPEQELEPARCPGRQEPLLVRLDPDHERLFEEPVVPPDLKAFVQIELDDVPLHCFVPLLY